MSHAKEHRDAAEVIFSVVLHFAIQRIIFKQEEREWVKHERTSAR